jgi:membrane protease YdiL (CAAX protease family)
MDKRPSPAILVLVGAFSYVAVVAALWLAARHFHVAQATGGSTATAVASIAILLAPYWVFGFDAAAPLRRALQPAWARVLAPGSLVSAYLVFSIPRGEFLWSYAVGLFGIPVAVAAVLETTSGNVLLWQDVVALALLGVPVLLRWFQGAFPHPGMSALPKLLLTDAALYGYLVVRRLDDVGFDLRPHWRDARVGLREWAFFAPFGIGLGFALRFIGFHRELPGLGTLAAAWLSTFLLVALPEELFFRGILMNLLEPRLGRRGALVLSSVLFGLSHFNKRAVFNWRYVILAFIAGIFYARAWRDRCRLFCSGITHATVDVVWGIWFR